MSIETDLVVLLKAINTRIFFDFAPTGTATPYVVFQQIGGETVRYGDNTADSRWPLMQISVWSKNRPEALAMIRQVEDAMCASGAFQATPQGDSVSTYEPATQLYGSIQRFELFGAR